MLEEEEGGVQEEGYHTEEVKKNGPGPKATEQPKQAHEPELQQSSVYYKNCTEAHASEQRYFMKVNRGKGQA